MKKNTFFVYRPERFNIPGNFLVAVIGGVLAFYISLLWKMEDIAHAGMSAIFGLAIGSLLWEKRRKFISQSRLSDVLLGSTIIFWGIAQPLLFNNELTLRLIPLIGGLGLAIMASGLRGIHHHWRELTMLFFLMVPKLVISAVTDISPLTAKFSAFLLWYSGFDVSLVESRIIALPTGSIKVYGPCSGLESMTYLLGLSVVCLILYPLTRRIHQVIVPLLALVIGFSTNAIRVMALAVLSAQDRTTTFDYWHEGEGSLVVGMIGVLILGTAYYLLLSKSEVQVPESADKA